MKTKVMLIAILILLSMPVTVGIITAEQKELKSEISLEAYIESEPRIMIRTNELHYDIGENVEITYTNVGGAVAGFVVGTARPVIPRIIEADTGNVLFLTDPNDCHPCVMLFGVLEPGDSLTMEWDQQYYGYYGDTFTPSEQVPEGQYYVEIGYWKVTGKYILPCFVPGGPPDHFTRSRIFTICDI